MPCVLELGADALRDFDPLSLIAQIILEYPALSEKRIEMYALFSELYTNALEHGVLGLDSHMKNSVIGMADYYAERERRLSALEEGSIKIHVQKAPDRNALHIRIDDSGPGFDYESIMETEKWDINHKSTSLAGRGMTMAYALCESIQYSGKGSCVEAVYLF